MRNSSRSITTHKQKSLTEDFGLASWWWLSDIKCWVSNLSSLQHTGAGVL